MHAIAMFGWAVSALALAGACYNAVAAAFVSRFAPAAPRPAAFPAVTILKPLHGEEPGLEDDLATFCAQDYPAPVQIVFGVQDAADPAIGAVERLRARFAALDIALVCDARRHGANAKISNLVNMRPRAKHGVLVVSDSDIAAPPDYLRTVMAALQQPGAGAVSCFYSGLPTAGLGSLLCAMGIDYQFLPNALTGVALGLAEPCFGSTIALRGAVLDEIGGFQAFADFLADDYEIGRALRARGYHIALPAMLVRHACGEKSLADWLAHELRWARTIRIVAPAGHIGSIVTHAIPLALIGAILCGFTVFALSVLATTLAARAMLKWRIDRLTGAASGPIWLLPVRDVLSFGVFAASLFGGRVEWRGERLRVGRHGEILR